MLGTIRQRLVLLVLLVAVPLVAATILVVYHLAQTQQRAQRNALLAGTRTLATAIDGEIDKHITVGKALATSRSLLTGDLAEFHRQAVAAMEFLPESWLLLVDPDGRQLVNSVRAFGEALPKLTDLGPHQRAMSTGEPQVTDVFQGSVMQRPLTSVHVPVMRDGKAIYNLIVTMDPGSFLRILQQQQIPNGWLSGIIDRSGNFVARSRDHDLHVGKPASAGWREAARRRMAGELENLSLEGDPLFSAFINSPLSGWSISIAATQRVVTAPFRQSLWLIGLGGGGLIAISIGLAWWGARQIAEPMRSLQTAADALLHERHIKVGRTGLGEIDRALVAFEASTNALLEREERQRLLVNELNHRVKNTLAVIQSIASVTSRSASSAASFSRGFISRIIGIARTHDLLTASHWQGASLRDILANELHPYQTEGIERVTMRGPPVQLTPKSAVALGMVLHEMATNAAKYGALSAPDGRLHVSWDAHDAGAGSRLRIEWTETGGPPVSIPNHQGFGSRLIRQSLTRELGGDVELDYRPGGLHCVLEMPLDSAVRPAEAA